MQTLKGARKAVRSRTTYAFRLTPAEWRAVLADGSFLEHPDNCCRPRRLMGVPVEIIPDHRFITARWSAKPGRNRG